MTKLFTILAFVITCTSVAQVGDPVLGSFFIGSSQPSRIYFDSKYPIRGSSTRGFEVPGYKVSRVHISQGKSSGHYVELDQSLSYWDNVLIGYDGSGDLESSSGRPVSSFTLRYVENEFGEPKSDTERYVSSTARGGGDGRSESSAWTLSEGSKQLKPGMVLWIKAGDYGKEKLDIREDGTAAKPIKLLGYVDAPGDARVLNKKKGLKLDSSQMPLLRGGSGSAVTAQKREYLIIKNLQITNYEERGINIHGSNYVHIENCYITESTSGIWNNSNAEHHTRAVRNYISNMSFHGIKLAGEHNMISDNYIVSDRSVSMDYYAVINGHESRRGLGNMIRNNYMERYDGDSHKGHGAAFKGAGKGAYSIERGLIEGNEIVNHRGAIELRHSRVMNNVVRANKVYGIGSQGIKNTMAIKFRDGSSKNIVEGNTIYDVNAVIRFHNSGEDKTSTGKKAGFDNVFMNNVCYNATHFILADSGTGTNDNKIVSNTIYNVKTFTSISISFGSSNIFENNNIIGCKSISKEGSYDTNNFYDNSFSPQGKNTMSSDPRFEDSARGNFKLRSNSPVIDKGKAIDGVDTDKEGNPRTDGQMDIGAYEYTDSRQSNVEAEAGPDRAICLDEEVTLTATGGDSYRWSTGETTASITVSPLRTTTYSVRVSSNGNEDTDEVTVTVNEVTADAGKDLRIDLGETVTLTASGGERYEWSTGETTASIVVKPDNTTTYYVSVQSGSCTDTDQVKVIINNTEETVVANAGSDKTICYGVETVLTASGGEKYRWSTGETTKSIRVKPEETTTYTVTVSVDGNEDTDKVKVNVNRVVADAGEDKSIDRGEEVTLTAKGGDSYVWSTGETTRKITVSPAQSTTYTVEVFKGSCSDMDQVRVEVSEETVSDDEGSSDDSPQDEVESDLTDSGSDLISGDGGLESLNPVIYPNPSNTGVLNIEVSNLDQDIQMQLLDMTGKVLLMDQLRKEEALTVKQFNTSRFEKGVYFLILSDSNQSMSEKIVIL